MSRRNNASNKNSSTSEDLPRMHPAEHYAEHRRFLQRSLERNDADLAALCDLNKSLHAVKQAIVRLCGESSLLDLGQGHLRLAPGSDALEGEHIPEEGQEMCVDFLLRMKLRRKLLNRFSLRLLRLAVAMDGKDVAPPGPPKYGDLRLHIDEVAVREFEQLRQRRDEAWRLIETMKEINGTKLTSGPSVVEEEGKETAHEKAQGGDTTEAEGSVEQETKEATSDKEAVPSASANEVPSTMLGNNAPVPDADGKGELPPPIAVGPASESVQADTRPSGKDEEPTNSATGEAVTAPPVASMDVDPLVSAPIHGDDDMLATAYDILRDYKTAYEKEIYPSSDKKKFTILDQQREEDYTAFKNASGIGAVHRSMNAKEKEAEFKRWQASILSRIPEQPTFDELGTKNRVFLLKERRKRALEKSTEVLVEAPSTSSATKKSEGKTEDVEDMDVDDSEGDESKGGDELEGDMKQKADYKKATTPSKKSADKEDVEKEEKELSKRMKPISLVAVPSFYEQDLKRIKLVHQELMATSIQNHARRRLDEVTRDYNAALRKSNDLFEHRQRLQARLIQVSQEQHGAMGKATSDYSVQFAVAKNRWSKNRVFLEQDRLSKVLPSRFGHPRIGTPSTQQYTSHHEPLFQQVGDCVADMVDVVEGLSSGQMRPMQFAEQFVPPPTPSGFPDQEALQHQEAALRRDLNGLQNSLRQSEEERNRCWKKMLKTKAEFEVPQGMRRVEANSYSNIQPPPLRSSTTQSIPQQVLAAPNLMASYTPAIRAQHLGPDLSGSTSKYSAARVRERIADDGTVAPVSEPKKTKEGLYQRPAGRTRKGMEWDALRGIWVPSTR